MGDLVAFPRRGHLLKGRQEGGFYNSFFGQLASGRPTDVSGLPSGVVIAVKGALYCVGLFALYRSVYRIGDR